MKTCNESSNFTPSIKHSGFNFHWQFYQQGSDYMAETISVYVVVYIYEYCARNLIFYSVNMASVQTKVSNTHHISTKLTPTHYLFPHCGIIKVCRSFQPAIQSTSNGYTFN